MASARADGHGASGLAVKAVDAARPAAAEVPLPGARVAYLVNHYPKVSHTFVRREILALERAGVTVLRYAMRGWDAVPPDPEDAREQTLTRYLVRGGLIPLLASTVRTAAAHPGRFWSALVQAMSLSRRSDRGVAYHFVYLFEACCLLRWLQAARADHVHAHFGTNGATVALLVRNLGGPPYSFTVHGPEEFDRPEAIGLAAKIAAARFVVAISSYGRSQLYRWSALADWAKVHVVHCGLERGFHAAGGPATEPSARLVCVGRLCEQKGQLLLIDAASRLAARGIAFELVLAGDGEMRAEIEAAIRDRGLASRVRVTGWVSSAAVRDEMLAARALVLPSFAEGLPVVIMEAMSLGRPVVSTFVAGIPELVRADNGWLVPAGDVEALADAMEACLATTAERLAEMGRRAKERVLARHDIDVSAARLSALFRSSSFDESEPSR